MGANAYGGASGSMSGARLGNMMAGEGRWWEAFGTGGFEGEPSLMEGEQSVLLRRAYQLTCQNWVSTLDISCKRVWLY